MRRKRVRRSVFLRGVGEAVSAKVQGLVVVGVPASVLHRQIEFQVQGLVRDKGLLQLEDCLAGMLRLPGPASIFQALISKPSMAKPTSPKTRRLSS